MVYKKVHKVNPSKLLLVNLHLSTMPQLTELIDKYYIYNFILAQHNKTLSQQCVMTVLNVYSFTIYLHGPITKTHGRSWQLNSWPNFQNLSKDCSPMQ